MGDVSITDRLTDNLLKKVSSYEGEAALVLDKDSVILAANKAARAYLSGRESSAVTGKQFLQFLEPMDRDAFRSLCRREVVDDLPLLHRNLMLVTDDAAHTMTRITLSHVHYENELLQIVVLKDLLPNQFINFQLKEEARLLDDISTPFMLLTQEAQIGRMNNYTHSLLGSPVNTVHASHLFDEETLAGILHLNEGQKEEFNWKAGGRSFDMMAQRVGSGIAIIGVHAETQTAEKDAEGSLTHLEDDDLERRIAGLGPVVLVCDSLMLRSYFTEHLREHNLHVELKSPADCTEQSISGLRESSSVIFATPVIGTRELDCIERIATHAPNINLLVVCIQATEEDELQAIRAGARGLISSEETFRHTLPALIALQEGELWCPRSIMFKVLELSNIRMLKARKLSEARHDLTRRELEVLEQVAQNLTNKQIADKLGVAYTTVVTHVYNIYRKLNVSNRYQAIRFALNNGIVDL